MTVTKQESCVYRGLIVPITDKLCSVLTLNGNKIFINKDGGASVRKKIVSLRNTDKRVQPFTIPPTERLIIS